MADNKIHDLMKKLKSLKDLRDAISLYKSFKKDEKKPEVIEKADDTAVSKPDLNHGLQYLGRKQLSSGKLTHMIGVKGSNQPYYEMTVDLHKHAQKQPSITISHVAANGQALSHHNQMHSNVNAAVKEINRHYYSKKWTPNGK
jgi:hypothetical protein